MGSNLVDEIESENLFDQIDDLIDFPSENGSGKDNYLISSNVSNDFPNMLNDTLPIHDPLFSVNAVASDLSAEISLPYEDIAQLEWLSTFVEESFSSVGGMTLEKEKLCINNEPPPHKFQFQTSSPDSVLESSSNINNTLPQRARSKRPRPATFNPPNSILSLKSENKKSKIEVMSSHKGSVQVRKCMHCEITKTPQWRAGPMGPKTLCNACGVRHKSGRLFPEYRPAASPTFVPALHSNSHKKVVELRNKTAAEITENLGILAKPDEVDSQ